jgi:hypothetical protein
MTTIYCSVKDCLYNEKNNHKCTLSKIHYKEKCLDYIIDIKYLKSTLSEYVNKFSSKVGVKLNE